MEMLYKKVGRRYIPVGHEFFGFPADGIWLVSHDTKASRHIMKIGELPDIKPLVDLEMHRDAVMEALVNGQRSVMSMNDIVTIVFKELAKAKTSFPSW